MTVAPAVEAAIRLRRAQNGVPVLTHDLEVERAALLQLHQAHEFQTRQRTNAFGAFMIMLAVLGVAYAVALSGDLPVLAALLALLGAMLVPLINRLDAVHRTRLHSTEQGFRELDSALVAAGDPSRLTLIGATGGFSVDVISLSLQAIAFWAFAIGGIYALIEAL